ncbi:MAG TPA: hypothetical protein DC049_01780, partial [Spirochaetia bacterium]|nr:hypothetical protein [Spirochaetia bacterium]
MHAELLKKFPAVHFVSRLDRETSGIVFCAKKSGQVKNFVQALGKSRKMYLVLTHGISRQKRFTVSMMLAA